jgi:hypothetical protein
MEKRWTGLLEQDLCLPPCQLSYLGGINSHTLKAVHGGARRAYPLLALLEGRGRLRA